MKPAAFSYHRADSIGDALRALSRGKTRVIAGGQSIIPMLNQRVLKVDSLVDISKISELSTIADIGERIQIGAGVQTAAIEDGAISGTVGRMLAEIAAGIGYRAVRNQGTIGGGVAYADPAGDWPAALLALDATITSVSSEGTNEESIEQIYRGPFSTTVADNALIKSISIRKLSPTAKWSYYKFSPTIGEVTKAIAVVVLDTETDFISFTLGAADSMPVRLTELEARYNGKQANRISGLSLEECAEQIVKLNIANTEYKNHCLSVALVRAARGADI